MCGIRFLVVLFDGIEYAVKHGLGDFRVMIIVNLFVFDDMKYLVSAQVGNLEVTFYIILGDQLFQNRFEP